MMTPDHVVVKALSLLPFQEEQLQDESLGRLVAIDARVN